MEQDKYIRIKEVSKRTGFSMQTIRSMIKNGMLQGYLINNRWYTTEIDYDKFRYNIYCDTNGFDKSKLIETFNKISQEDLKRHYHNLLNKLNIPYDEEIINLVIENNYI